MENIHIDDEVDLNFRITSDTSESDGVYKDDNFPGLNIDRNNFHRNGIRECLTEGKNSSSSPNADDSILGRNETYDVLNIDPQNVVQENNSNIDLNSNEQKDFNEFQTVKVVNGFVEQNNKINNHLNILRRSSRRSVGGLRVNKPNHNPDEDNDRDSKKRRGRLKNSNTDTKRTTSHLEHTHQHTKRRVVDLQNQVDTLQREIVRLRKHLNLVPPSFYPNEERFPRSEEESPIRGEIDAPPIVTFKANIDDAPLCRKFHLPRKYSCPARQRCYANHDRLCRRLRIHSSESIGQRSFNKSEHKTCRINAGESSHHRLNSLSINNDDLATLKRSHDERPYMCDVCGLRFIRRSHMVRHSKVHTGEKPFYCDECGRSFARLNHLQRHGRTLHQKEGRSFRCYLCSSVQESKEHLRQHMSSHNIQNALLCPHCCLEFKSQFKLSKHAKLCHQGDGTVDCEGGGANNGSADGAILPRPKNHTCDQCNKTYKSSSALVIHKRTHSGERPYICEVCATGFSRSSSLIRHRRSHTGEKPHVCHACKKAYARKHLLSSHVCSANSSASYAPSHFMSPSPTPINMSAPVPTSVNLINESADALGRGLLLYIDDDKDRSSSPFSVY